MREAFSRARLESFALVLILIFFGLAGAVPGIAPKEAAEMTGEASSRFVTLFGLGSQLIVNAAICVLLLRHAGVLRRLRGAVVPVLLLGAFTVLSTCWSADPLTTARRAVPFAMAGGLGVLLTVRPDGGLRLFRIAFLLLALWSALLALGFPAIGLDASAGHSLDWRGAFTQKNACGRAMVFATAAVLATGRVNWRSLLSLAVFLIVLVMSGSRGAWVIESLLLLAFGALWLNDRFSRTGRVIFLTTATVAAGVSVFVALEFYGAVTSLMGRDATLTGRTEIWRVVWQAICGHPWLGYGFSGFWHGAASASWHATVALGFVIFHAHNGLLEIWLELGLAGVLLFAGTLLRAGILLLPEVLAGRGMQVAWPLSVLLLILLYDVDENTLLSFNSLFWVFYAGVLVQAEILHRKRQHARQAHASRVAAPGRAWLETEVAGFPPQEAKPEFFGKIVPQANWLRSSRRSAPWL